ncbi:terminase small subunit [Vibrio fluvialis]|nr:terminase small subunit [Vibrio fluvialis]MBY8080685.1 terminase small subunit [Vibrio fluvialis]MBY8110341.1 terminase small subunit [Vibrio fluvialis]MBY8293372.1 terminase small subunit [Vibrio fluvialis]MBY8310160.1 terminase small subunit [Vibrio fluvialis]
MTNVDLFLASSYRITDRYDRFCHEMLIDLNPTKAVRRTGCYSHKYAKQQAWRLMRNPIVRARIAELMDQRIQSAASVECVGIRSNRDASKLMLSRDTAWLMNYQD